MDISKLTADEFQQLADRTLNDILTEAKLQMQRKIAGYGIVLTGDLLNSLHSQTIVAGKELSAEFRLGFRGYGRFKDMRSLLFMKMPPISVLKDYVEKVGTDAFDYVPGYFSDIERKKVIPESRRVNRIAWGIGQSKVLSARMRDFGRSRANRKSFYNPTRGKLVYEVRDKVLEKLLPVIMQGFKQEFQDNSDS